MSLNRFVKRFENIFAKAVFVTESAGAVPLPGAAIEHKNPVAEHGEWNKQGATLSSRRLRHGRIELESAHHAEQSFLNPGETC
jgi:hypothetical protein